MGIRRYYIVLFFGAFILLGLLVPSTTLYKKMVSALWHTHHPLLAYYLNYRDPVLAIQIGNYYFGDGEYDLKKAATSYERAIRLDSDMRLAHYQLSRIYFVWGDMKGAREYINKELIIDPYTLRSLYVRGLISLAENDLVGAESDFARFVEWAPGEWGGYNDLAFTLLKEEKYAEAENVLKEAFKKMPDALDNPWLWNSLGLSQLNQFDYVHALDSFTMAVSRAKILTPEEWQRSYSANNPNSAGESIASFQQAIEKNLSTTKKVLQWTR